NSPNHSCKCGIGIPACELFESSKLLERPAPKPESGMADSLQLKGRVRPPGGPQRLFEKTSAFGRLAVEIGDSTLPPNGTDSLQQPLECSTPTTQHACLTHLSRLSSSCSNRI